MKLADRKSKSSEASGRRLATCYNTSGSEIITAKRYCEAAYLHLRPRAVLHHAILNIGERLVRLLYDLLGSVRNKVVLRAMLPQLYALQTYRIT